MPDSTAPRVAPRPPGHLILGHTLEFQKQPLHFVERMLREHGDVVHFNVALLDWYLVAHPDAVWDITVGRPALFQKPRVNKRIFKQFLGNGLVSSDGEHWKRQHKLILPGFHRSRIEAYGETMVRYTLDLLDTWQPGETRDFCADMNALTLRIVAKTLFNADVLAEAGVIGEAMRVIEDVLVDHINLPLPLPRWWPSANNRRKIAAIDAIEGIILRVVEERRASGEDVGDLLSMMVFAQDEAGQRMSNTELRDEAMTLIFAGHETTAHAITWMWFLLSRHPAVLEHLDAELARVLGGRAPTVADLPELPYLEMVVKESMRVLPSVWTFMREPVEDVVVGGFRIPKGAQIFISPYLLHHDARWFPEPERFDPERFTKENEKQIHRGAYLPFSAGPRICLGKSFAMMETRLILGTLVQRARPSVPVDHVPEPVPQLSYHPRNGLPTEVVLRG